MAQYLTEGLLCQGIGGQYSIRLVSIDEHRDTGYEGDSPLAGMTIVCSARGKFRHAGISPMAGDHVLVSYSDATINYDEQHLPSPNPHGTDALIADILPRKTSLIRPAMANLETMIIVSAVTHPVTPILTIDKLTAIAHHNHITPVVLITKAELDPEGAARLVATYRQVGIQALAVSAFEGIGLTELQALLPTLLTGKIACLTGTSGVGKSTIMNLLFPDFNRKTGAISERIQRGRNTTREITLFDLSSYGYPDSWLADTPGFSMIDFEHFDFMEKDDLFYAFPEFAPYLGECQYQDCAHIKEDGCALLSAVREGRIPGTRHESYAALYAVLKEKKPWNTQGKRS